MVEAVSTRVSDLLWELGTKFEEITRREGTRNVVVVTRDVVDYFTDIARATDRVEMGGFLLGRFLSNHARIFLFHDYVQARNVSEDPEVSYLPDREAADEVFALLREGRYDAVSVMHTHPDEAAFSDSDLSAGRSFAEETWEIMESSKYPEDLWKEIRTEVLSKRPCLYVPNFLVTGGYNPVLYVYAYATPFIFTAAADGRGVSSWYKSKRLCSEFGEHCKFLEKRVLRAVELGLISERDYAYILDCIYDCYFVAIPIKRLEKLLPPEV